MDWKLTSSILVYSYDPSEGAAILFCILFGFTTIAHFVQTWCVCVITPILFRKRVQRLIFCPGHLQAIQMLEAHGRSAMGWDTVRGRLRHPGDLDTGSTELEDLHRDSGVGTGRAVRLPPLLALCS